MLHNTVTTLKFIMIGPIITLYVQPLLELLNWPSTSVTTMITVLTADFIRSWRTICGSIIMTPVVLCIDKGRVVVPFSCISRFGVHWKIWKKSFPKVFQKYSLISVGWCVLMRVMITIIRMATIQETISSNAKVPKVWTNLIWYEPRLNFNVNFISKFFWKPTL